MPPFIFSHHQADLKKKVCEYSRKNGCYDIDDIHPNILAQAIISYINSARIGHLDLMTLMEGQTHRFLLDLKIGLYEVGAKENHILYLHCDNALRQKESSGETIDTRIFAK